MYQSYTHTLAAQLMSGKGQKKDDRKVKEIRKN